MKIQYLSDLHLEFHNDDGKWFIDNVLSPICEEEKPDVLVIAGDLAIYSMLDSAFSQLCSLYKDVVYVAGNHEFYYSSFDNTRQILYKISKNHGNFHFLDNSTVIIGSQRFIGCTLWFRYNQNNVLYQNSMNDFHIIDKFTNYIYTENENSIKFLNDNIKQNDIVITHHLPAAQCIDSCYRNSRMNRFYMCDMEDVIMDTSPSHWIFGHTHSSYSGIIGSTQLHCNAYGYRFMNINDNFNPRRFIEGDG